jgi:hypothetical protein
MRNNMVFENDNNKPTAPDELLKTTSLLYFKEALRNQQIEQCPALIKTAKRFGAGNTDIRKVINEYTNRGKAGRRNEARQAIGGRLRFLKEE